MARIMTPDTATILARLRQRRAALSAAMRAVQSDKLAGRAAEVERTIKMIEELEREVRRDG
jgi:hypothetical protein